MSGRSAYGAFGADGLFGRTDAPGGTDAPGIAGALGALGGIGDPGALGGIGAAGALGGTLGTAIGAPGALLAAAIISASVAPHWAQALASGKFMKPQIGQAILELELSAAPHSAQTLAMGLLTLPHSGQLFILISAGLKHIFQFPPNIPPIQGRQTTPLLHSTSFEMPA
jgi:hypothetical protein